MVMQAVAGEDEMNCPYCGVANADGVTFCGSCGQQLGAAQPAPPVSAPAQGFAPAPPAPPAPPVAPYGQQPYVQPPQAAYAPQQAGVAAPKNHLVMAILATALCCVPVGVVAIIFASQVNSKFAQGDWAGAQRASKNAATWSWIAIIAGGLAALAYTALMVLGILSEGGF
jgi:hypothetical protein